MMAESKYPTREDIFRSRTYLQNMRAGRGVKVVISPDLDGWQCGLYLTNKCGCEVVGIYNNRQLAIHQDYRGCDCVFVDCDVASKHIISIGHHITNYSEKHTAAHRYNPLGIQINQLYGTYCSSKEFVHKFDHKYPYSTIMYLMWLFEYDLMGMEPYKRFLVMQADGTSNSIARYAHSSDEWDARVFGDWLEDAEKDLSKYEEKKFTKRYRQFRTDHIPTKAKGQGKGTEKVVELELDGTSLKQRHIPFIRALGEELDMPYQPDRWTCWDDLRLFRFESHEADLRVGRFREVAEDPNLISLIISSTAMMNYTLGDPDTIREAFTWNA